MTIPFAISTAYQCAEARKLLSEFQKIDPFAMIAGGAVRDWDNGVAAQDLDIYVRLPNHNTMTLVENLGKKLGIQSFQPLTRADECANYATLPNLQWVFEGTYSGIRVNVMVMEKGVREEIVKDFDVAICRCWWDGERSHFFPEYDVAMEKKICLVHPNYTGEERHIRKMKRRFPEMRFVKEISVEPVMDKDKCYPVAVASEPSPHYVPPALWPGPTPAPWDEEF